jgi:hypothetical protein
MATQLLNLYNDNSTIANFAAWASAISSWFATCGWVQTRDTGQVMWTGMNITACSYSAGNSVYTYNTLTGLALQNGRALTITGMTQSANNGTFVITSFTGTTSGTFTVANASGVTESGSSGVVTKITSVPGSNVYVSEFWQPTDGGTVFTCRLQYGNQSSTNCPNIGIAVSDTTNGTGTMTGNNIAIGCTSTNYTIGGTGTQYECRFAGDASRVSIIMWRNGPNNCPMALGVERQRTSTGTIGASHVTVMVMGWANGNCPIGQYTLIIGQGVPQFPTTINSNGRYEAGMPCYLVQCGTYGNFAVNGVVGVGTTSPWVGYWDYPLTMFGIAPQGNFQDGQVFTANLYGSSRTWFLTSGGQLNRCGPGSASASYLMMRYD